MGKIAGGYFGSGELLSGRHLHGILQIGHGQVQGRQKGAGIQRRNDHKLDQVPEKASAEFSGGEVGQIRTRVPSHGGPARVMLGPADDGPAGFKVWIASETDIQ